MKKVFAFTLCLALVLSMMVYGSAENVTDKFKGQQITYYSRWMEADEKWMMEEVIAPFQEAYGVTVTLKNFEVAADMISILDLDKDSKTIGLFEVTDDVLPLLVQAELVAHTNEYADPEFLATFTDAGLKFAQVDGEQYFVPRSSAPYMMMYMKTPVEDAIANWETLKDDITASLKEYNGYGLPDGYTLESDLSQWDAFDLAVAGYYWANTEFDGVTAPRMAHRARMYEASVHEIVNKVYQMGGTMDDVLAMNTQPVVDAFAWENYYANAGIYIPEMWLEGWGGGNIYQAMADGACYLAFMHISDAFTVHGLDTPAMPGYLADPAEMGLALIPAGNSLEIENGQPARPGISTSVAFGWVHAVPVTSPDYELSCELLKWVTKPEYAARWAQVGASTYVKEVVDNMDDYLAEPWMVNVYEIANAQLELSQSMPQLPQFPSVGNVYLEAWYDIVVGQNNQDIAGTLTDVYAPKAAEALQ